MKVSIIVAVAENNVIGKDNRLVWRLPADMKYFKDKTSGHFVITGRKNYESIPDKFRPLPDRVNIVVTRNAQYQAPGATVTNSIESALEIARKQNEQEAFIIGGADIYRQSLGLCDTIYLTRIHHQFEGDAFFSDIDERVWKLSASEHHEPDEKNQYSYTFCEYKKV